VKSLVNDFKNFEGLITFDLAVRSIFETTNTHRTPDNRERDIAWVIFKIDCDIKPQ
jgi:hypothetical protein